MSIVWKIIRIIGLYIVFFVACSLFSAIALDSLPDWFEGLFILLGPGLMVWLYEKRRASRIASDKASSNDGLRDRLRHVRRAQQVQPLPIQAALEPPPAEGPKSTNSEFVGTSEDQHLEGKWGAHKQSRTQELREKLFGDNSSIFDPKNSNRVEAIASRVSKPTADQNTPGELAACSTSQPYRPRQDNSELVRVGKAAREALEAASLRRAAEKETGAQKHQPLAPTSSTSGEVGEGSSRPSRIKVLREKLFGDETRLESPSAPERTAAQRPIGRDVSRPKVQGWVPKGQTVTIGGRAIDGMVYVGSPPKVSSHGYGERCRAYIDPSLSVASFGSDMEGDGMSYWPGYSTIPAVCRATYLDWLAGGRQDVTVNPGFLFLFFYGLERRFLVDQPSDDEKREVVAEVERLKSLFSANYSVQRYLGEFLDIARIMAMGGISLDDATLKQAILENRSWDLPFSLKFALGGMIAEGKAFDAEWLHLWLHCHPERRLRTPAERCGDEFKALFKLKFDALYPDGLKVRTPRKLLKIDYRAASGEFNCSVNLTAGDGGDVAIPDVTDLRSPVQKAQKIADEAMDELDKFSRYLGRNPDGRGTIEAQALLPAGLWSLFPSDELEELKDWAHEQVAAGGLVPALDVLSRLEGETPEKLGKRNLTGAADALARIGFGMAPDPRFSLRGPKIDEPVVIFELGEPVEQLEDVSPAYRTELFELALATFVAHADSKIVEAERRALREKIEATRGLTELERKRLHANLEWYLDVPPDMSWLRSKLKDAGAEHHLALRAAVVAIAHADSVIQSEEVACIEKIYKALGIDAGLVYADLHAGDVPNGPVRVKAAETEAPGEQIPDEPKAKAGSLDAARIAAIRNDTERVSSVLGEIFSTDEDVSEEATAAHALPSSMAGLDPKHAMLVEQIIQREHWTDEEFDEIVGKQGLMPSGALEVVNEWSFDKFDEALLDEYDGYDVSPDIAEALRAEIAKGD
ncbi:TerB N-terminal domain-containing protein [Croceibacterium aestuarii]|uniref:tellurite resistance TerB family protein n=1 Tax=Croceibacterium aestuarii TaxID=3064139 RepID=UPI00272E10B6|nr:TerB N-terminal domain-containing protein [Croceibacterium sp. D39]